MIINGVSTYLASNASSKLTFFFKGDWPNSGSHSTLDKKLSFGWNNSHFCQQYV